MLNKQKTREGKGAFAGSRTGDLENNRQEEGSNFLPVSQEKSLFIFYRILLDNKFYIFQSVIL